jgi:glucose-1-phosphate cytidylyltransferase
MKNNISCELPEVIILCGGKGERLRPITNDVPKPLVKINKKPILHYVIEHLKKFDIKSVNIACGYKSNILKKYFSDNKYDINIDLYDSGDVDIIKRIQDVITVVKKDVIVLYGDTISNVDITDLISNHRNSSKEMTMTVWPLTLAYGLVEIADDGSVESFTEKPTLDKWINIGYFYINKHYNDHIFKYNNFEYFLLDSANNKAINAYKHQGLHITVNTLSELEEAQSNIKSII